MAILCHGLGDHKNGFVLPQLAEALAQAGLSSLRFDFPGNGESDGTFRYANMMDEVCNRTFLYPLAVEHSSKDAFGLSG